MNKRNLISSLEFKNDLEEIISVGENEKENRNEMEKLLSKNRTLAPICTDTKYSL